MSIGARRIQPPNAPSASPLHPIATCSVANRPNAPYTSAISTHIGAAPTR